MPPKPAATIKRPETLRPIPKPQRAERRISSLMIGLCAPSGGGKTLSALRLAAGLTYATSEPIVMIDTENGRGLQYAPSPGTEASPPLTYDFMHLSLEKPFSPDRIRNAVYAAAQEKPGVIIIDSMTHEWQGVGGMLDMVDEAGGQFRAWKEPKKKHLNLMNRLSGMPCHVILCMRAKERYEQVSIGGKWEIVNAGFSPVCETGLPYDMTINLLLKGGVPQLKFDCHKFPDNMADLIDFKKPLDEHAGRMLAAWCHPPRSWDDCPTPEPQPEPEIPGED